MFPPPGGLFTARRARGGILLLAFFGIAISQLGLHCHRHAESHSDDIETAMHGIVAGAAHGADGHQPTCRPQVSQAALPTLRRTTDAWWVAPALSIALLAAEGSARRERDMATIRRPQYGALQSAVSPAGIGLLVSIGVLRA